MFVPQGTVLPVFFTLRGFLSVSHCYLMLTSSLRADNQSLSLDLTKSCTPQQLSGSLTHSFPVLKNHGLPPILNIEANSEGSSQAKSLFIKVGTCHIRANRVTESKTQTKWLWGLESKCPLLQVKCLVVEFETYFWKYTNSFKTASVCVQFIISCKCQSMSAVFLLLPDAVEWLSVPGPWGILDLHGGDCCQRQKGFPEA